MPARSRRAFSRSVGSSRRRRLWVQTGGTITALASGSASVNGLVTGGVVLGTVPNVPGATVVRTIVQIQVPYVVASDFTVIGLIVGRESDPGFNIPDPVTENTLPWAWNEVYYANSEGAGAAVNTLRTMTIDTRSKRRIPQGDSAYLLCVHNGNAAAATYRWTARVLTLLP